MPTTSRAAFSPDLFRFLRDLAKHNERAWFQANKARYEESVLGPAVRFVAAMGPKLAKVSSHLVADARPFGGSVARIYRDTRFSKDKSPYRTNVGIHFSHDRASQTDDHLPGFYLHLAPGESMLASGVWHPAPDALAKIRDAIVSRPDAWARASRSAPVSGGESYVRVPSGYDSDHRFATDLRRKDFFSSVEFPDRDVVAAGFERSFLTGCAKLDPLNRFLADALGIPW